MYYLISIFPYTIMAKNIGTLVISIRKCNPAFFWKCFGINMFIYFLHWNNTKKNRRKVKSDTIPHRTQKNAPNQIIGTHELIFGKKYFPFPFGKKILKSVGSCNHEWVLIALYWNVGPHRCSVGFRSGLISELTSALFVAVSECFLKCVSGHCPAGRPMTYGGVRSFLKLATTLHPKIIW